MNAFTWVTCDGGPHLFASEEVLVGWSGTAAPAGRFVRATFRWSGDANTPASDYDAACDIDELTGLISVGTEVALVLGDEAPMSTWVRSPYFDGGVLVIPMAWPAPDSSEVQLLAAIDSVAPEEFNRTGLVLPGSTGRFRLCAACDRGPQWLYPTLSVDLVARKSFHILSAEVQRAGFWLRLHGLRSETQVA
jgi:hypothetical protein